MVRRVRWSLLVLALVASACSSGDDEPTGPGASTPAAPSPPGATAPSGPSGETTATIEAEVQVGGNPIGIATGEGSLWVVNSEFDRGGPGSLGRGTVLRVTPPTTTA